MAKKRKAKQSVSLDINYLPKLPKSKRVPIGCIGSGFIMADCHLVAYRNAGFNPVAIASKRIKNAKAVSFSADSRFAAIEVPGAAKAAPRPPGNASPAKPPGAQTDLLRKSRAGKRFNRRQAPIS